MGKNLQKLFTQLPTPNRRGNKLPAANGWEQLLVTKEEGDCPGHVAVGGGIFYRHQNQRPLGHTRDF